MRLLNQTEKTLCDKILQGNKKNNCIANIIDNDLQNICIALNRSTRKVELHYTVDDLNNPTKSEINQAINKINEISVLILTLVNLIKILEKEGYIMLLKKSTQQNQNSKFGQCVRNKGYITNHFPDINITNLLLEYEEKEIIITEEFNFFCENNYTDRVEIRYQNQLKTSNNILKVGICALVINIIISIINLCIK